MVQHIERMRPPGRNDPCPCGSGKKYKRCCLLQIASVVPVRRFEDILAELHTVEEVDDLDGAIAILEEARHDLPGPDLDTLLVERYLLLPPERAEPALRQWWEEEHDRFSGAGLARILIDDGRRDEALHVLTDSRGADAWPAYWHLLAHLRDEDGDTEGAAAAMELYTRVAPENVEAWMMLGDLQLRLGQHDRALQSFRRAGDAVPDHILPRMARLRILAEQGRWRETRDLAEALLEGRYEDAAPETLFELRDLLARAYFILGYFDAARRLWESLLTERPDEGEVLVQLASLELTAGRHQRVVALLEPEIGGSADLRLLEIYLRSLLDLREFDVAGRVAAEIAEMDPRLNLLPLVHAAQGVANKEYVWALDQVTGDPPEPYRDLWYTLRLECLAHLGRWQEMWPVLRVLEGTDDAVLTRAALGALAAGKLDLVERLLAKIEDQQSIEARALGALLGPVRQSRRAAEARRQQQVDQAERQRWAAESRELRRHIRDLEQHNAALADALALSEEAFQRLLERMGVLADDSGATWEAHVQGMAERAHKDALAQELRAAEQRLRGMLGTVCWERLSEATRASLREGEWLFAAVEGADRDYGAALLEFARGLERGFKDVIFIPARTQWQRWPGPIERLQDEAHDPSLGPFVRFVLQSSHLTLGSMAAALDRMSDIRRQGVAVNLLRRQIGIDAGDERALSDWKRTAERLAIAAEARNQPAHAAAVSRDAVCEFRDLVLGTDGLLRALANC
jgi:tetratricopeptide (TPR) repeat protein